MLKCLFMKRKLYDYLDSGLSDIDKIKVKAHLDKCDKCKVVLEEMKDILDLTAQKKTPEPSDDFWHNFRIELDRKLNERLVPRFGFSRRLSLNLKPALAYTLALVFTLLIGNQVVNRNYPPAKVIAQSEEELVDELALLDELEQTQGADQDKDTSYFDEMELLSQFDQNAT